jgi:(2Fe-2S) ferredoxin
VSKPSVKVRRSKVIYTRVTLADYARLIDIAKDQEMGITDLVRSYLSVALRSEGLDPLNQVPYNFKGRFRGPNVRRG